MSEEWEWNDTSRDELRETLRSHIRGELRLMRSDPPTILAHCNDVFIADECPESEHGAFHRFAVETLNQTETELAAEKSAWPLETDCDRLDRVEATLRGRGILLWQVSPCCNTCTRDELPGYINKVNDRHPGTRDRIRGYTFFIDQNMPEMLSESTKLSLYLGYGTITPHNRSLLIDQVDELTALGIAREVAQCLQDEGIEVDWDGSISRKIGVSLNWLRRQLLV